MRLPGNSTISKLAFFDVLIARFPWQRRRGGTPWLKEVLPALAAVEGPTPLQATTLVMSLLSPTAFPQCHQQRFLTSFPQNKQINTCKKNQEMSIASSPPLDLDPAEDLTAEDVILHSTEFTKVLKVLGLFRGGYLHSLKVTKKQRRKRAAGARERSERPHVYHQVFFSLSVFL